MKIIYLGIMYCEESLQDAYRYARQIQTAPQVFQQNLLAGMEHCQNADIKVINVPLTGSFPINYKKLISKRYEWGKDNVQISFLNLPYIKHFIQYKKITKLLEKELKKGEKLHIIAYTLYTPFLKAIRKLKRKYDFTACVIQTDPVPGREDLERFSDTKSKKRGDKLVRLAKSVDGFVLLTKYLADAVEVGERAYTVVECIGNTEQPVAPKHEVSKNICLYTGVTNRAYNLCEFADAFVGLENAELWICGRGDADEYLKALAEKHENIKHFGYVPREEAARLQGECDFLINPRRPTGTYTKHSFPSKTVEYMMTGKPVVMYKLEGIPDEYDEYLNYIQGEDSESIRQELCRLFSKDYKELLGKGERARSFVKANKNGDVQAKKIVDFLETINW